MNSHYNNEYPRFSELAKECDEDNFFSKTLERASESVGASNFLRQREEELCRLDEKAWQAVKDKVKAYAKKPQQTRGYAQVIDVLNEVKGYNYLKDQGYENVEFIEEGDGKTPDLHATGKSGEALMEVKTLGWSDSYVEILIENTNRMKGLIEECVSLENLPTEIEFPEDIREKIRYDTGKLCFKGVMSEEEEDALLELSEDESYREAVRELFDKSHPRAAPGKVNIHALRGKLKSTVKRAKEQLTSSRRAKNTTRKICYLFVMLDPFISRRHYKNELAELDKYLNNLKEGNPEIEIICGEWKY